MSLSCGRVRTVKVMQRRATIAVALTLGVLSAPVALQAQINRQVPDANTPRLLVAVFASNDKLTGVQIADAVRSRITTNVNVKTLYAIPRTDINNYLESSGYKADSALGPSDLKELAKLLRADEVFGGTVTKTATGIRVEPRLMLARDVSYAQPLPMVEAANANDAAKAIEKSLGDARKQMADYKACWAAVNARQFDKAVAAANAGIVKYPQATIARLCLASAYQGMNLPADSVLRVTDEIRRIDPKNSFVLRIAYGAYKAKADSAAARNNTDVAAAANEQAVRTLVQLLALEPNSPNLADDVIAALARLGKPAIAIPIVDTLLLSSPGDAKLLQSKWRLALLASATDTATKAKYLAMAVSAGEEMVRADTTLADSAYFARQIIAANAMTPPRGAEFASKAVQRFPNIADFWALKANAERKAGQSQMALQSMQRAISLNPQTQNANLFLAQTFVDLNQVDSAVAISRRAVASGEDKRTWGAFLIGPTQSAWKEAEARKDSGHVIHNAALLKVLALAEESDKLSPTEFSAFFAGVSAFFYGFNNLQDAQKPKSCDMAKIAQDMFGKVQIYMPRGGKVDANTAKQLLQYTSQYAPSADQMVKQYCKGK
jgi:tetratricopeptide (TPR) repeat protein